MSPEIQQRDTIDLREILGALRRGIRWLPVGLAVGIVGGALVNLLSHRYEGEATVVLRDRGGGGSLGAFSEGMMGGGLASGLGEALSLPGEFSGASATEAAILAGRSMLRGVVEELGLQVRVVTPRGLAAGRVFAAIDMEDAAPRGTFTFRRSGSDFEVRGTGGFQGTVAPGGSLAIPGGSVTLAADDALPDRFKIQVRSKWATVDQMVRKGEVEVESVGGDLAEVVATWTDPATAAAIANTLVDRYLGERRTRMRGLTGERLHMLAHLRDSLGARVDSAAEALRRFHRASGTFDPDRLGDLERVAELRARVDAIEVEARALDEVLQRLDTSDDVQTADLLAFPSFLESPAINQILQRLTGLRDQRAQLLERRTPLDPDVQVVDQAIQTQEQELIELARSYRDGLDQSLEEIEGRLASYRADLSARPQVETESLLLENRLEVSTATYVAVQTQVVRSRLESVGEGAELRQVDFAVPPDRPRFPRPKLNLALGTLAGLVFGTIWAVAAGALTTRVVDASQVRDRLGLPVVRLDTDAPLPTAVRDGTAVVVSVNGTETAEQARALLRERGGLDEQSLRVERPSYVRDGQRVVVALREREKSLGAAEELLPGLRAAGAIPVAAALVPNHRRS